MVSDSTPVTSESCAGAPVVQLICQRRSNGIRGDKQRAPGGKNRGRTDERAPNPTNDPVSTSTAGKKRKVNSSAMPSAARLMRQYAANQRSGEMNNEER